MSPLPPPESHAVSAALGWMELGLPEEALGELDRIDPGAREHHTVLEARWMIHASRAGWKAALEAAERLTALYPESAAGWLHLAYALRRVEGGGLEQARTVLASVAGQFPEEPVVPFNLACYDCQLGNLPAARVWLKHAFEAGGRAPIQEMALKDPDLEPLWPEIAGL